MYKIDRRGGGGVCVSKNRTLRRTQSFLIVSWIQIILHHFRGETGQQAGAVSSVNPIYCVKLVLLFTCLQCTNIVQVAGWWLEQRRIIMMYCIQELQEINRCVFGGYVCVWKGVLPPHPYAPILWWVPGYFMLSPASQLFIKLSTAAVRLQTSCQLSCQLFQLSC